MQSLVRNLNSFVFYLPHAGKHKVGCQCGVVLQGVQSTFDEGVNSFGFEVIEVLTNLLFSVGRGEPIVHDAVVFLVQRVGKETTEVYHCEVSVKIMHVLVQASA